MRYLAGFILLLLVFRGTATEKGKFSIDVDVLSRHYWRGSLSGNAPAFEPNLSWKYGGFSFSMWAAFTTNNSYTEFDLIPSYTYKNITATLYSYYNPVQGQKNNYFNFSDKNNRHSVEFSLTYNGKGKLPVKTFVGTFLYGDDNSNGNARYSTYIEFGYPQKIKKTDIELLAGFTPFKGYYANQPAFVSTGVKTSHTLQLATKVQMPVKLSFLFNPHSQKAFIIFGLGIRIS